MAKAAQYRFATAVGAIKTFFNENKQKVFSRQELEQIFRRQGSKWNLPISMNEDRFIKQLLSKEIITLREITFEGYIGKKECFTTPGFTVYGLAAALIKKSYLSHYTAVFLQGLTTQVPKTIYITFEQSKKRFVDRELKQEAIDQAFAKPQRKTGAKAVYEDFTLIVHTGMFTNRMGITHINEVPVTGLERTLIDIMVRPNYAGGVQAVVDAFKNAQPEVSLNKLIATLDNLNFIYPYHQALGFYLEKAGYEGKRIQVLRDRPKPFTFYLTYEMQETDYSRDWNLYYPKGM